MRFQRDFQTASRSVLARLNDLAEERFGYRITQSGQRTTLSGEVAWLVRRLDIDLVIDVGAHEGEFATLARGKAGYKRDMVVRAERGSVPVPKSRCIEG